jgi:drug/metabolite transporter (DMT)-like permease
MLDAYYLTQSNRDGLHKGQDNNMNNTMRLSLELILSAILIVCIFVAVESAPHANTEWHSLWASLPGLSLCSVLIVLYRHHKRLSAREQDITLKALAFACLAGVSLGIVSISRAAISPYPSVSIAQMIFVMAMTFTVAVSWLNWRKKRN